MAKVIVEYLTDGKLLKTRELATTGDQTYIFHDIDNLIRDGDFGFTKVPRGTNEIVIRIPVEGY